MITKIEDRNLILDVFNYDVILVPMSIHNSFNKGFKYEIALNFPEVKENEKQTPYGDARKYGTIHEVKTNGITFCLCYMYSTPYYRRGQTDFVRYDDLLKCLKIISKRYHGKRIASPLLGNDTFDGNGDEIKIFNYFQCISDNINITLYYWKQTDYSNDIFKEIAALHKLLKEHTITPQDYIMKRSEIEWRRRYGIFKEKPKNYMYIPRKGEIIKK